MARRRGLCFKPLNPKPEERRKEGVHGFGPNLRPLEDFWAWLRNVRLWQASGGGLGCLGFTVLGLGFRVSAHPKPETLHPNPP